MRALDLGHRRRTVLISFGSQRIPRRKRHNRTHRPTAIRRCSSGRQIKSACGCLVRSKSPPSCTCRIPYRTWAFKEDVKLHYPSGWLHHNSIHMECFSYGFTFDPNKRGKFPLSPRLYTQPYAYLPPIEFRSRHSVSATSYGVTAFPYLSNVFQQNPTGRDKSSPAEQSRLGRSSLCESLRQ